MAKVASYVEERQPGAEISQDGRYGESIKRNMVDHSRMIDNRTFTDASAIKVYRPETHSRF